MFPVFLDVKRLKILLVGQGEAARHRVKQLRDFGAENLLFYDKLVTPEKMLEANLVLVIGLEPDDTQRIVDMARSMSKLVNVEDDIPNCDFFYASTLKRGDFTIAVGTNGKSPTLARTTTAFLSAVFDERWEEWTRQLGEAREDWRADGADATTVKQRSETMIMDENMQPLSDFLRPSRGEE